MVIFSSFLFYFCFYYEGDFDKFPLSSPLDAADLINTHAHVSRLAWLDRAPGVKEDEWLLVNAVPFKIKSTKPSCKQNKGNQTPRRHLFTPTYNNAHFLSTFQICWFLNFSSWINRRVIICASVYVCVDVIKPVNGDNDHHSFTTKAFHPARSAADGSPQPPPDSCPPHPQFDHQSLTKTGSF